MPPAATDPNLAFDATLTPGQRLADRVARFGGTWTFIGLFFIAMTLRFHASPRFRRPSS